MVDERRSLDDVVAGGISHPSFREMIQSESSTNPSTQRSTHQSPLDEFRSLFWATRQPSGTSSFQARTPYSRPSSRGRGHGCSSNSSKSVVSKNKQTQPASFCREIILQGRPDATEVVRGHAKVQERSEKEHDQCVPDKQRLALHCSV